MSEHQPEQHQDKEIEKNAIDPKILSDEVAKTRDALGMRTSGDIRLNDHRFQVWSKQWQEASLAAEQEVYQNPITQKITYVDFVRLLLSLQGNPLAEQHDDTLQMLRFTPEQQGKIHELSKLYSVATATDVQLQSARGQLESVGLDETRLRKLLFEVPYAKSNDKMMPHLRSLKPEEQQELSKVLFHFHGWPSRLSSEGKPSLHQEMLVDRRHIQIRNDLISPHGRMNFQKMLEFRMLDRLADASVVRYFPREKNDPNFMKFQKNLALLSQLNQERVYSMYQEAVVDDFLAMADRYAKFCVEHNVPLHLRNAAQEKTMLKLVQDIRSAGASATLMFQIRFGEQYDQMMQLREKDGKEKWVGTQDQATLREHVQALRKTIQPEEIQTVRMVDDARFDLFVKSIRQQYPQAKLPEVIALPEKPSAPQMQVAEQQKRVFMDAYAKLLEQELGGKEHCVVKVDAEDRKDQLNPQKTKRVWMIRKTLRLHFDSNEKLLEEVRQERNRQIFDAAGTLTQYKPYDPNVVRKSLEMAQSMLGKNIPVNASRTMMLKMPHVMYANVMRAYRDERLSKLYPKRDETGKRQPAKAESVREILDIDKEITQAWIAYSAYSTGLNSNSIAMLGTKGEWGPYLVPQGGGDWQWDEKDRLDDRKKDAYQREAWPQDERQVLFNDQLQLHMQSLEQAMYLARVDVAPYLFALAAARDSLKEISDVAQEKWGGNWALFQKYSWAVPDFAFSSVFGKNWEQGAKNRVPSALKFPFEDVSLVKNYGEFQHMLKQYESSLQSSDQFKALKPEEQEEFAKFKDAAKGVMEFQWRLEQGQRILENGFKEIDAVGTLLEKDMQDLRKIQVLDRVDPQNPSRLNLQRPLDRPHTEAHEEVLRRLVEHNLQLDRILGDINRALTDTVAEAGMESSGNQSLNNLSWFGPLAGVALTDWVAGGWGIRGLGWGLTKGGRWLVRGGRFLKYNPEPLSWLLTSALPRVAGHGLRVADPLSQYYQMTSPAYHAENRAASVLRTEWAGTTTVRQPATSQQLQGWLREIVPEAQGELRFAETFKRLNQLESTVREANAAAKGDQAAEVLVKLIGKRRAELVGEMLGKPLTPTQSLALAEAHAKGFGKTGTWSQKELFEKAHRLSSEFPSGEVKEMLRTGAAGDAARARPYQAPRTGTIVRNAPQGVAEAVETVEVTAEEIAHAQRLAQAAKQHPEAAKILTGAKSEVEFSRAAKAVEGAERMSKFAGRAMGGATIAFGVLMAYSDWKENDQRINLETDNEALRDLYRDAYVTTAADGTSALVVGAYWLLGGTNPLGMVALVAIQGANEGRRLLEDSAKKFLMEERDWKDLPEGTLLARIKHLDDLYKRPVDWSRSVQEHLENIIDPANIKQARQGEQFHALRAYLAKTQQLVPNPGENQKEYNNRLTKYISHQTVYILRNSTGAETGMNVKRELGPELLRRARLHAEIMDAAESGDVPKGFDLQAYITAYKRSLQTGDAQGQLQGSVAADTLLNAYDTAKAAERMHAVRDLQPALEKREDGEYLFHRVVQRMVLEDLADDIHAFEAKMQGFETLPAADVMRRELTADQMQAFFERESKVGGSDERVHIARFVFTTRLQQQLRDAAETLLEKGSALSADEYLKVRDAIRDDIRKTSPLQLAAMGYEKNVVASSGFQTMLSDKTTAHLTPTWMEQHLSLPPAFERADDAVHHYGQLLEAVKNDAFATLFPTNPKPAELPPELEERRVAMLQQWEDIGLMRKRWIQATEQRLKTMQSGTTEVDRMAATWDQLAAMHTAYTKARAAYEPEVRRYQAELERLQDR